VAFLRAARTPFWTRNRTTSFPSSFKTRAVSETNRQSRDSNGSRDSINTYLDILVLLSQTIRRLPHGSICPGLASKSSPNLDSSRSFFRELNEKIQKNQLHRLLALERSSFSSAFKALFCSTQTVVN